MITIKNSDLTVSVLDPKADGNLLGSRYCHGGYIWQIEDNTLGPLLAGPKFPNLPDTFDGQGMPEVFETALSYYPSSIGDVVLVIGVGEVIRSSNNEPFHTRWNPEVKKLCDWVIGVENSTVEMKTEQSLKGYSFTLTRKISVIDRTVQSSTEIMNRGPNPLPMKWFAHPFFPINSDHLCCKASIPLSIPPDPGFAINDDGYIYMKKDYNWESGCYRSLGIPWNSPLSITVKHPLVNQISVDCNFNPTWFPIWANSKTFSCEPFYSKMSAPDSSLKWTIQYNF